MARLRISLNEGSLLRRTVLHVGAFVLGTAAFLAVTSFLLVTLMKAVLPSGDETSPPSDDSGDDAATTAKPSAGKPPRPPRKKKAPAAPTPPAPSAEEE